MMGWGSVCSNPGYWNWKSTAVKQVGFNITMDPSTKIMDIEPDLELRIIKPYTKPNNIIKYVNESCKRSGF